jgi:hypothetical protein
MSILQEIMEAIIETVEAVGDYGAPGGTLYAVLMQAGIDYDMYCNIMAIMVAKGMVRREGELYFPVTNGGK